MEEDNTAELDLLEDEVIASGREFLSKESCSVAAFRVSRSFYESWAGRGKKGDIQSDVWGSFQMFDGTTSASIHVNTTVSRDGSGDGEDTGVGKIDTIINALESMKVAFEGAVEESKQKLKDAPVQQKDSEEESVPRVSELRGRLDIIRNG